MEKICNIYQHLGKLTKEKKNQKTQIIHIRKETGYVTPVPEDLRRIISECYEQLYTHQLDNLDEMDRSLTKHRLPHFNYLENKVFK